MSEVKPKNAFTEWLQSDEGKSCTKPDNFSNPDSIKYLQNRLWYAYIAGVANQMESCISEFTALRSRIAELEKANATLREAYR